MPNFMIKFLIGLIRFLDRYGILPKFVIDASPFHTSVFLTNVGSLGIDSIYHHVYDFGTTSIFIAMGKKKKTYIYEEDTIKEAKAISFSFVCDERVCDGQYFASSIKLFRRYLKRPELLEKPIGDEKSVESEDEVTV
ncbi:MAG: 2-oxo acid dehydrogenase subunit E2 [Oscillospiraceae bacterium]|nr:2-oxo acid dehydrogenase subunit E2 [Oscillospiraceae bacterium]